MNNTVSQEQAKLAAYYGRGSVKDPLMQEVAELVASGELSFAAGANELVQKYIQDGGDLDLLDAAEARIDKRLSDLALRIQEGLDNAPLAIVRPDIHPLAAAGLGIDPDSILSHDEINALLAGRRSDGGFIEGKRYAVERALPVDPKTGEKRYSTPIGSYDFCPTPDKSVSVAWGFADPVEQARIYNAHIEAAREAVAYIAQEIGQARIGDGGKKGYEPGHVGWLEFTHHTSRRVQITTTDGDVKITQDAGLSGDPDLHTHFLLKNAVFCESGRVGSLDTAALAGFIFEADAFYHARLGQRLRDAGFPVELDQRTGAARMSSVPLEVCNLFSKRRRGGEAIAQKEAVARGEIWDDLSKDQQASRIENVVQGLDQKQKGGKDDVADFADWKRQAKEACGWEPTTLQLYGPPPPPLNQEQRIRSAYEYALPFIAEKLEQKSVLPHWDLRVAAARGLVHAGIDGLQDIDAVTKVMREDGVDQYGGRTSLVWGFEEGKRYTSITTSIHELDEREFIHLAKSAAADVSAAIPEDLLKAKIEASGLDFSGGHGLAQISAIHRLGRGGRFSLAIGSAGSGKTTILRPIISSWKEQGRDVHGASLAWRQADALVEAGIERKNLKAFSVLIDTLKDGSLTLGPQSVVVVDEWGLLGTRQGLELLRLREKLGFQVVSLGDDKQCASVSAGPIIELSRQSLGVENVPEMVSTVRQQTMREREIVGLFRQGRAAEALDMKRADGTAEMAGGGYEGVVKRVAKLYAERLDATGEAPGISAPTNADAHQISAAVRIERRKLGLVGPDIWTAYTNEGALPLAKGDRVRLFHSTGAKYLSGHGGSIGRNGSVLEVMDANEIGVTLKSKTGKVGIVDWADLRKNGKVALAYGDVLTIHTAQGSTAREHIFALPGGSRAVNGLLGYTANTRHRQAAYIVTNEVAERIDVRSRRPINDARDVTIDDRWANVARALSYQPEKDSALALMERVNSVRRGTVRMFHDVMARGSDAPDVVDRRRMDMHQIPKTVEYVRQHGIGR